MKNLFNKYKLILIYIIILLFLSFISTILELAGINYTICTSLLSIINYILIFMYSYIAAKKVNIKGYISGLKSALKILIVLLIMNLVTLNNFNFKTVVYYLIIIIIGLLGGIIGKNSQKKLS